MHQQFNRNARKLIRENTELILTEKTKKRGLLGILGLLGLGGVGGYKLAGGEDLLGNLLKGALIGGATYGGVQHIKKTKSKSRVKTS